MKTLILSGWTLGFDKIEANRFLRTQCGITLSEAKEVVDRILLGVPTEVLVPDESLELVSIELSRLGLLVTLAEPGETRAQSQHSDPR